jgi:response regulator RpfG family c-di-GMP phosphodiesterase
VNYENHHDIPQDETLVFLEEQTQDAPNDRVEPWTILIVDDEEDVHGITRMVLGDVEFDGRGLHFLSAHSGIEAKEILRVRDDVAVILLDVVMESEHAGLDLVHFIRAEQKNTHTRIILRTGQPGQAPERRVILEYDINDYKEKSNLTATRLFTTIVSALRCYRDIKTIEQSRKGLGHIISAARDMLKQVSFDTFCQGVLEQMTALWNLGGNCLYMRNSGFAALREGDDLIIRAGIGAWSDKIGRRLDEVVERDTREMIHRSLNSGQSLVGEREFVGCYRTETNGESLLYLSSNRPLAPIDVELIRVFSGHIAAAYDNLSLHRELRDTQREIIYALGEVVEQRSREVGSHVRRVGEQSWLLATLYGMCEEEADLLRIAAPMHDVGKIGIPDHILSKPGKLTLEEFKIMEQHTLIGYRILSKSRRRILNAAATIAYEHHEHWDGGGYPRGLKKHEIHIYGRITAIADVLDALYHKRSYKEAWVQADIVALFRQQRERQFDPHLVDLLLRHWDEFIAIQKKFPD